MKPPRSLENWAVFISGRGSNLQAVLDLLDSRVVLVVTNSARAAGLLKAKRCGIPVLIFREKDFAKERVAKVEASTLAYQHLSKELRRRKIRKIFLLGYMRLLPQSFIVFWEGKIQNVHPSLLPNFPGLHAIEKSFQAKAEMGVTVHKVIPEMDAGEILLQKKIPACQQLTRAQLLISMTEQNLVREAVRRWS